MSKKKGKKKGVYSRKTHHYVRAMDPNKCTPNYGTDDVGRPGGHVRIACEMKEGGWGTQAWRLPKDEYHIVGDELKPKTPGAKRMYSQLTRGGKKIKRKGKDWEIK